MLDPWEPKEQHPPSHQPVDRSAKAPQRSDDNPDDDGDQDDSTFADKEGASKTGSKKSKHGVQATPGTSSSAASHQPTNVRKACLQSNRAFTIHANLVILQQQWQQQKSHQHLLPDLRANAAAFHLTNICGVVGKGASGYVFAARYARGYHSQGGI